MPNPVGRPRKYFTDEERRAADAARKRAARNPEIRSRNLKDARRKKNTERMREVRAKEKQERLERQAAARSGAQQAGSVSEWIARRLALYPLQVKFLDDVFPPDGSDGPALSYLSQARGGGKTTLLGHVVACSLTPESPLYVKGANNLLFAASVDQAQLVFKAAKTRLTRDRIPFEERGGVKPSLSTGEVTVTVMSSSPKTAQGIGSNCRLIIADEPSSWRSREGELMWRTIRTSLGKDDPDDPLAGDEFELDQCQAIFLGTRAPSPPSHWYQQELDSGTNLDVGRYVMHVTGDPSLWRDWSEVERCCPRLTMPNQDRYIRKVTQEWNEAKDKPFQHMREFQAMRLNCRMGLDGALQSLTDVHTWDEKVVPREAPPVPTRRPESRPWIGLDIGGATSWCSAAAAWTNGRVEVISLCPQTAGECEQRDGVQEGTYRVLVDAGSLIEADVEVPKLAGRLWELVLERWGLPMAVLCDRYRKEEVELAVRGRVPVIDRVNSWSHGTTDIRCCRRWILDGPMALANEGTRKLLEMAIENAVVECDDSGNMKMLKAKQDGRARDDAVMATILAVGGADREATVRPPRSDSGKRASSATGSVI